MTRAGRKRNRKPEEWKVIPFPAGRPPSEPEPTRPTPPAKSLTQEEALEVLWSAKSAFLPDENGLPRKGEDGKFLVNPNCCNAFVYGTLQRDVDVWRGTQDERVPLRVIPKGTRVLVTVVSRFGHVGIRDHNLEPASNGYCAACQPEDLADWNMAP